MSGERVLIVEDEKNISRLVKYNLEKANYQCLSAASGEEALEILARERLDLVILDVMLPKMDGFEVCRRVRQDPRTGSIPVILLTAKGEEVDRVVGLELGADDYIVKPFSPRELVLRVKAVLRRGRAQDRAEKVLVAGAVCVDIPRHRVSVGSREIPLTRMEFKLLVQLIKRRGVVQTREALLNDLWDIHSEVDTRTVDTHVKRLREKLGRSGSALETVTGIGYRWKQDDHET